MAELDLGIGCTVIVLLLRKRLVPDNTAAADTPPINVRLLVFTDHTSHVMARTFPPKIVAVERHK